MKCVIVSSRVRRAPAGARSPAGWNAVARILALLLTAWLATSCERPPPPPHRLVGTWTFSPERTVALSRDEKEQFESTGFGPLTLRVGADGFFAMEAPSASKAVPQASRWELTGDEGAITTIRVTRPDKPAPESMRFEFQGHDEIRLQGERRLVFQRAP